MGMGPPPSSEHWDRLIKMDKSTMLKYEPPPCVAVLWGAKEGHKFTNRLCGEPATTEIGTGWYCSRHIKTLIEEAQHDCCI